MLNDLEQDVEVSVKQQQKALERLKKRVAEGEHVCDVLRVHRSDEYFANKVLQGLIPVTSILYERIMSKRPTVASRK